MKKEIPILFSTPMVFAVKEECKIVTRRLKGLEKINDNPNDWEFNWMAYDIGWCFNQISTLTEENIQNKTFNQEVVKCPYGQKGDILWIRETFANGYNDSLDQNIGKEEKDWTMKYWTFKDGSQMFSDGSYFQKDNTGNEKGFAHIKWKPSIHMPKAACRFWLEIKSIKVERLNSINPVDAIFEGIDLYFNSMFQEQRYRDYLGNDDWKSKSEWRDPVSSFKSLWQKINGKESWDLNPWVWVIEFKKTNKPK